MRHRNAPRAKMFSEASNSDDRDTLHTTPLCLLPLKKTALKGARMVKNRRLESAIELYRMEGGASGLVEIENVSRYFDLSPVSMPDLALLARLAAMHSFDIYNMRIFLRAEGLSEESVRTLTLSPQKIRSLDIYMSEFTRPLVESIFGKQTSQGNAFDEVLSMIRKPNVEEAAHKLKVLAAMLGVDVKRIPDFLEDYADMCLSISYYNDHLKTLKPVYDEFLETVNTIERSRVGSSNAMLAGACKKITIRLRDLMNSVASQVYEFDRHAVDMWHSPSADKFRRTEALVKAHHKKLGGILCALSVKMAAWENRFPNPSFGSLSQRGEFILNEMQYGLDKVARIEEVAVLEILSARAFVRNDLESDDVLDSAESEKESLEISVGVT